MHSLTISKDMTGAKLKQGHVITPLLRVIVHHMLGLDVGYVGTEFDHCTSRRSRDMVGAHHNLNGSRNLTTPLSGVFCNRCARTCYSQPAYQI